MITLTIEGRPVTVPEGTTILEAAKQVGVLIPHYCYHPGLPVAGVCRMCLVDVEKAPKLAPSCATTVAEGQVVRVHNEKSLEARKGVLEMLLINHPLDCPVCDQAGECDLQNFAFEHGVGTTRYEEERRTFEKIDIGPLIQLHMTRCILCYRCVYTANQVASERVHGVLG
ncbi:MAG: 2Fe-2S iron-sulfur cluster-binding protein, partial [Gemmatimonadota bacterium]|nr:2Fe-2S iron-sulfur cluster-binding protein [Gemmatimonadota bacterium]